MTLIRRDRIFICFVGLAVVVACAAITLARPAAAQQVSLANATYTIVSASGQKPIAYCPSGTHLLGGGGHGTNAHTYRIGGLDSRPITRPHGQPSGWEYYVRSETYSTIESTAYAICARL